MAKEIQDFGEKIGGARKDFYAVALNTNDLKDMNDAEQQKYVKRDSIWKRENASALIEAGIPREVAYWRNEMRLCMYGKPADWNDAYIERYITVIGEIRDLVQKVTSLEQQQRFFKEAFAPAYLEKTDRGYQFRPELQGVCFAEIYNVANYQETKLKKVSRFYGMNKDEAARITAEGLVIIGTVGKDVSIETDRERVMAVYRVPGGAKFFYSDQKDLRTEDFVTGTHIVLDGSVHRIAAMNCTKEEAETKKAEIVQMAVDLVKAVVKEPKKRKREFPIPQLTHVRRTGPNIREAFVAGEDLIETFHIRGGEFGKWMSDADAAESLNKCYDAFADLGRILDIPSDGLSFDGKLAIGFGSRGHSAAAAHYEPSRQVINLTKYRGQGALCHEWAHALDHAIGQHYGCREFASEETNGRGSNKLPRVFLDLVHAMAYKTVLVEEEEILKEKKEKSERMHGVYIRLINPWKSKALAEEESVAWDKAVADMWEKGTPALMNILCDIRKKAVGRIIPKKEREDILWYVIQNRFERGRTQEQKTREIHTDFYTGSSKFESVFSKMGHHYWSSRCEMFARAFDCYISDKLKERGEENTYLTYGADSFVYDLDGVHYAAIPEGEERETLNKLFDELIEFLKKEEIL